MNLKTKKLIKKLLALTLACLTIVYSGAGAVSNNRFRVDTDRNYLKYINGFSDNTFRPDIPVTRAQSAKMMYYVLDLDSVDSGSGFSDVSESYWGYNTIMALNAAGILKGYSNGKFNPDAAITRAEFATAIARAMGIEAKKAETTAFSDVRGHWACDVISSLAEQKIISGYRDGTFKPDGRITRAEAVKLINNAVGMKKRENVENLRFTDLKEDHWAYSEIMSAATALTLEVEPNRSGTKFSEIDYVSLSKTDFISLAKDSIKEFKSASAEKKAEIFMNLIRMQLDINTAITMTSINIYRDFSNAEYKADYAKIPEAQNALTEIYKMQYQTLAEDSERDAVCDIIGVEFAALRQPSEPVDRELLDLYTKETELAQEFTEFYETPVISYNGQKYSLYQAMYSGVGAVQQLALDYYVEKETVLNNIFDKLVEVRTDIAQYYNYENYYDIAYEYYEENVHAFREDVKKHLVPLFKKIRYAAYFGDSALIDYEFPDTAFLNNTDDVIDELKDIMKDLSPQSRQAIEYMVKYEMMDLEERDNKTSGAFSTYIDKYESPFLFMSTEGGFSDVSTFSHEFGHVLQTFRWYGKAPSSNIPLDVAECASTAMELLVTKRYDEFFGQYAQDAEKYLIYLFLSQIIDCAMSDEFQTIIYKNPEMTPTERNVLYRQLNEEYFGEYSETAHEAYLKGLVWSNPSHIYQVPFYMIEYALSSSVSLQIWEISKTDFDRAFETYMDIIESKYIKFGLAALTLGAKLESPFADNTVASISDMIDELFKKKKAA